VEKWTISLKKDMLNVTMRRGNLTESVLTTNKAKTALF
jgi:hypothetical protein